MARNDSPRDPYGVGLDISLVAADRIQRTLARRDVVLERVRLAGRRLEARQVAAKYESKERAAEAEEAVRQQARRFEAAREVAERSYIDPVDVGAEEIVVHGIVLGAGRDKLEVLALGDGDRTIAKTVANERGYFKLQVPVGGEPITKARLPVVGEAGIAPVKLQLAVRRGEDELYRDRDAFSVRPGRALYRELVVTAQGKATGRS